MKYNLVVQRAASSVDDYDFMLSIESELRGQLRGLGIVDGHDAGSGEVNIFIKTNDPSEVVQRVKAILEKFDALADTRIAYRDTTGSEYTILWPRDLKEFRVI
jgi:hypothetical protein